MFSFYQGIPAKTWQQFYESYVTPEFLVWVLSNMVKSLLVFLAAWLIIKVFFWGSSKYLRQQSGDRQTTEKELAQMIGTVLKTLIFYGAYFAAALLSLEFFGLNVVGRLNLLEVAGNLFKIVVIILVSRLAVNICQALIERFFNQPVRVTVFGEEKRIETLKVLLKSLVMYAVYFIALMMVLSILGVNTTSLLASAGIIGLAVGFGAQSLVKDIITGFFIIFENYFVVGDYINTAGVGGIVEEMGLRTTKIRDWSGELHIIPNSEITMVTNHSHGKMRALVEIGIAYEEDIDRALKVLQEAADGVNRKLAEKIVEPAIVQGIVNLEASGVIVRVVAYTKPMEQWLVERELRKCLKQALDQAGIEIPYPRQVIIQN